MLIGRAATGSLHQVTHLNLDTLYYLQLSQEKVLALHVSTGFNLQSGV